MQERRFSFAGEPGELTILRAALSGILRAEGWTDEEMGDVLLAAGKLATNAIVHARTPFDVRCLADEYVELDVVDRNRKHLPAIRPLGDRPGGFGLRIVERVARCWAVEQEADAKPSPCRLRPTCASPCQAGSPCR